MSEYYVWRVTNGRVTILGRDGKEHRYTPGDEFVCDDHQLRWRREQVECLRPAEENKFAGKEAVQKAEEPDAEQTSEAPADPDGVENPEIEERQHDIHHRGGGWYDVVDPDGNVISDTPVRYQEALQLAGKA